MATTYVERTIATGSSPNKLTISCWMKGMADASGSEQRTFFGFRDNGDTDRFFTIYMSTNGSLYAYWKDSSTVFTLGTSHKFRDPSAWGHFVLAMDTTDDTAADRVKMYWNGERITSFQDGLDTITQNKVMDLTGDTDGRITVGGGKTQSTFHYWDGCMSHVQYVDGLALTPTEFGQTDSTSGIWKIKTGSYATPGTNGFHLKMEDRANLDLDSSSNAHTFTTTGTLTPTCDNPSNNFATFDNLTPYSLTSFLGHERANTRTGTNGGISYLNLLPNKGKWFVEYHINTAGVNQDNGVGFWSVMEAQTYVYYQTDFRGIVWKYAGNVYVDGVNNSFSSDTFTSGDIISIAMDFDNDQATFYKNGTVATNLNNYSYNFSNHSTVSTGIMDGASSPAEDGIFDLNAGQNPTFGGRKTAGTNADANGHGLFSMAVPSGFYAICTKNIKLYGG